MFVTILLFAATMNKPTRGIRVIIRFYKDPKQVLIVDITSPYILNKSHTDLAFIPSG